MPSRQTLFQIYVGIMLLFLTGCSGGGSSPASIPPGVSGTITAAADSFIDSDTNDPNTSSISNDDFANAQELRNPFIVGGYVNAAADQEDHYLVSLSQGETLSLSISDHDSLNPGDNNLDLLLNHSSDGAHDRTSEGTTSLETITVPATATYEIVVRATSGVSKYVLTVAASGAGMGNIIRLGDDFVPGEILVRFREQYQSSGSKRLASSTMSSLGLTAEVQTKKRFHLVRLGNMSQRQTIMSSLGLPANRRFSAVASPAEKVLLEKQDTIDTIYALRQQHDVEAAAPNYIRYPTAIPDDPDYSTQWHYPLIDLPAAWDVTANLAVDTSGVTIAVIDTGVYMDHPDLDANLSSDGYDFISSTLRSNDDDGRDVDPDDPGDSTEPEHSSFHGTHVAGTIAAVSDNALGVAGVSWNGLALDSTILPLRVLGIGGGTSYDLMKAVEYAAGLTTPPDPVLAQPVDIINMSLSGSGKNDIEESAFTDARNAGVICIAAAGNQDTASLQYPASYTGVISVSAVDINKNKASYSNWGSSIDIAAPGGDNVNGVHSTWVIDPDGVREPTYEYLYGTSMATPHVAGVVALMKAIHPGLTPDEFDCLLASGNITEDIGQPGWDDNYGYGLINALKAVDRADFLANGGALPPALLIFPHRLDFGTILTSLNLTTSKCGGSLSIISITPNVPWLTVTADNVDPANLGTYKVSVDRTGLSDANYAATISIGTDNAGNIDVPVTMQVDNAAPTDNDAGHHYILLIDPITWLMAYTIDADSSSGTYSFSFTNIADGNYFIVAGTDMDNNGWICEPGEACGGYPNMGGLVTITYDGNGMSGLNFTTGFSIHLNPASVPVRNIPPLGLKIKN